MWGALDFVTRCQVTNSINPEPEGVDSHQSPLPVSLVSKSLFEVFALTFIIGGTMFHIEQDSEL